MELSAHSVTLRFKDEQLQKLLVLIQIVRHSSDEWDMPFEGMLVADSVF